MYSQTKLTKNPSRETCEKIIRRILITETLENGKNTHFRQASDFMTYFESLYPTSESLNKQVQRAIKSMELPRDEKGYFIINKTMKQVDQENELKLLFKKSNLNIHTMENCEPILLEVDTSVSKYLIHLLTACDTFSDKYVTIAEVHNGILIYTKMKTQLLNTLENLLNYQIYP
ncbi:hypothetical protein LQZ18_14605 [Lachnospiraceae bacterium ZAX-1]